MFFPLGGLALITLCYIFNYYYKPRHAANEPPVVSSRIPYVGHILGLLQQGTRYYQTISAKCKLPIYTLPMLNGKVYVVTSIDLVNAVNRNAKVLAFNPFIANLGKRMTGHDDVTSKIVQHNLNGENGPGYVTDIHQGTVTSLAPSPGLEKMTNAMLLEAHKHFETLDPDATVDLFDWIRQMMTMCSTRALYGPENPLDKDEKRLVRAFWDFNHDLNILLLNIAPAWLAPNGFQARSKLGLAFQKYFEEYDPQRSESSEYIKGRHSINARYGLTLWNQGRLEVGILLGSLANTIPTIFYLLLHVLADPALLRDIRDEIERTSVRIKPGESTRCLEVLTMRNECTLLHAAFQEVLRIHGLGSSARFVREDILLQDQYLLKKGTVVQMPTAVMHLDSSTWGADANDFLPSRFLKLEANRSKDSKTSPADVYRPFGGGASLCPGRHFVTLEAMALTASFVLRFDALPVEDVWRIPEQKQESMATNVFPPKDDIKVQVKERKGYEGVKWDFSMA